MERNMANALKTPKTGVGVPGCSDKAGLFLLATPQTTNMQCYFKLSLPGFHR